MLGHDEHSSSATSEFKRATAALSIFVVLRQRGQGQNLVPVRQEVGELSPWLASFVEPIEAAGSLEHEKHNDKVQLQ